MRNVQKKAKLAHEKRDLSVKKPQGVGPYTFQSVVDVVTYDAQEWALVDLDGDQTLGLVELSFTRKGGDGKLIPSQLACPAVYCVKTRERALGRYASYQAGQLATV